MSKTVISSIVDFFLLFINLMPVQVSYRVASFIGGAVFHFMSTRRRITITNMARLAEGNLELAHELARKSFQSYGVYVVDLIRLLHQSRKTGVRDVRSRVEIPQASVVHDLRRGNGVIAVGLHAGMWDFGPAAASQLLNIPTSVVVDEFENQRLNFLLQKLRHSLGFDLIASKGQALRIYRRLKQNNLVSILLDVPPVIEESVEVQFFGEDILIHDGPARLSILSGAPIIAGLPMRIDRYSDKALLLIEPVSFESTSSMDNDVVSLTQSMMNAIEKLIRNDPSQWHMYRYFWTEDRFDRGGHTNLCQD
tara:strand:+ start:1212 stop:2135 length:924 start_codon:yes stop_codon:yes gene_type:complete